MSIFLKRADYYDGNKHLNFQYAETVLQANERSQFSGTQ